MRIRHLGTPVECFSRFPVVLKIHVIDKAQIVVELPVVGIVLDAIFHQLNRALRLSRPFRRGRSQEASSKLISRNQLRIEVRRYVEQGIEKVVAFRDGGLPSADILHSARPIDIGKKAVVTQAGALEHLGRTEIQHFFDRGLWTKFVDAMKHYSAGCQKNDETRAGNDRYFAALLHFRFRCSKMSTAALRAMAA